MNWHFLYEKAFLSKVPGRSQGKGQEQRGRGSCRGREPDSGISPVVWGGCLRWHGKFDARSWGLMTRVVGTAPVRWLSGMLMGRAQCSQGSKGGEVRWGRPDLSTELPRSSLSALQHLSCLYRTPCHCLRKEGSPLLRSYCKPSIAAASNYCLRSWEVGGFGSVKGQWGWRAAG